VCTPSKPEYIGLNLMGSPSGVAHRRWPPSTLGGGPSYVTRRVASSPDPPSEPPEPLDVPELLEAPELPDPLELLELF
jgi:hypothetical protein